MLVRFWDYLIGSYIYNHKKELPWSLWVGGLEPMCRKRPHAGQQSLAGVALLLELHGAVSAPQKWLESHSFVSASVQIQLERSSFTKQAKAR